MDWDVVARIIPTLVGATGGTVLLTATVLVISTVLAPFLAMASLARARPLRWSIKAYSWIARSVPQLIFLYFAFFALPSAGLTLDPMPAAILAFVVFTTAYNLEILRGGLLAVDRQQIEAARALGLSPIRTMVRVVFPQMIPTVAPAYLTNATAVLKDTSLASVVAVTEITSVSVRLIESNIPPFEVLLVAAALYVVLGSGLIGLQVLIERRWSR